MLGEVTNEHVPARAGDARPADRVGPELVGQAVVQPTHGVEAVEHLRVARGISPAARHFVGAVLAVDPGSSEELTSLDEGVTDLLL